MSAQYRVVTFEPGYEPATWVLRCPYRDRKTVRAYGALKLLERHGAGCLDALEWLVLECRQGRWRGLGQRDRQALNKWSGVEDLWLDAATGRLVRS